MHWSTEYIGKQYPINGCWLFVADVYNEVFGVALDDFADYREPKTKALRKINEEINTGPWLVLAEPIDGAGVALTQSTRINHIGIYADIDGGRVLHTLGDGRVVAVTVNWLNRYRWKYEFYQCLLKSQ